MLSKLVQSLKIVALCVGLVSAPAMASTVIINNGTSGCSYTNFTSDANGNLTVNCTSSNGTGPGTLQFSPTSVTVTEGTTASFNVTRIGGSTGAVSADVSVVAGTTTALANEYTFTSPTTVNFADGDTAPKSVTLPTTNNNLSSSVAVTLGLSNATGGATLSSGTETVTIQGSAAPSLPAGCTVKSVTWPTGLNLNVNPLEQMGNGQMYAFQIPNFPSRGYVMSSINYATVDKYITISQTPCDFSTAPVAAYCAAGATNHNPILWNISNATVAGVCSLTPGQTYYFNVRNATTRTGPDTCAAGQVCTYYLGW